MMRLSRLLALSVVVSLLFVDSAHGQPRPKSGSEFPAAKFDSLDRIAFYLWQYDSFAWATSDTLAAQVATIGSDAARRLGEEWFCFKRDSTWHAVYGRFDEAADRYDAVAHYTSTGHGGIVRSPPFEDTALANRFGRALVTTRRRLPPEIQKAGLRFNSYVREREDGGIDVWYVPAWQQNGWIVYGAEFQYILDGSGRSVKDSIVRVGRLEGARPDSTASISLHPEGPGVPTVAELLFVHLYTKYFAHVRVFTRDWVSELFHANRQWAWIHALRQ
ncbi:MAG: hypothetical protein ABR582_09125 [Gemmatimonadaceae bacterium]